LTLKYLQFINGFSFVSIVDQSSAVYRTNYILLKYFECGFYLKKLFFIRSNALVRTDFLLNINYKNYVSHAG